RTSMMARDAARRGRHSRRRGLLARLLPVRRTTFVIDTDRTVLKVVSNELRASVHADQALWFLQNYNAPQSSPHIRGKHTEAHLQAEGTGDWLAEPEVTDEPSFARSLTPTGGRAEPDVDLPVDAAV